MIFTIPEANILTEKMHVNSSYMMKYTNQTQLMSSMTQEGGAYKMDRSGTSDKFNIQTFSKQTEWTNYNDKKYSTFPFVQINNSKNHEWRANLENLSIYNGEEKNAHKLHHSKFGSPGLKDVKQFTIGEDLINYSSYTGSVPQNEFYPSWRKVYFLRTEYLEQNLVGKADEIYEFNTIAEISDSKFDQINTIRETSGYKSVSITKSEAPTLNFKYSHIYVVPCRPTFNGDNSIIAKIYYAVDKGVDHKHYDDMNIKVKKMSSSGISSLGAHFEQNVDVNDTLMIRNFETTPYKVGEIKVSDYTYYDFAKEKRVKGFSNNSTKEDKIPYSFKGSYIRDLNISLNAVYDDVNISLTEEIDTPLLDPSEGDVQLIVDNTNEDKEFINYFDSEDIKLIRKKAIKSITGLNRISNVK